MAFEHIVQINDLTKPELPILTCVQIREGLVLRALRPDKFLVNVDEYEILEQEPASIFVRFRYHSASIPNLDKPRY